MQWTKSELLGAISSGQVNFGSPLLEAGQWSMLPLTQGFDKIENSESGLFNVYLLCRCTDAKGASKAKKIRLDYDLCQIWLDNPTKTVTLEVAQATFENSITGESRSYNTYSIVGGVELADKPAKPMTAAEKRKAAKAAANLG